MNDTTQTHRVGAWRAGNSVVWLETNDAEFAAMVDAVFADLRVDPGTPGPNVTFTARRADHPWRRWSVYRDGQARETTIDEDHVLFHLQWELNRLVIESGDHPLHAGAVEHGGRAVLIAGHSGSGKSTLTAWLAARGWGYVGDEVVTLHHDLTVTGFQRPIGLRRGGPFDALIAASSAGHQRFATTTEHPIPATDLGARLWRGDPLPVSAIVLPTVDPSGESSLTPVGQASALMGLGATGSSTKLPGAPARFERIAHLAATVPAYAAVSADLATLEALLAEALA